MTARITCSMSEAQVIEECRAEMDAARAIPGGGAFLHLENFAGQTIMRLIVRQADRIRELEQRIIEMVAVLDKDITGR